MINDSFSFVVKKLFYRMRRCGYGKAVCGFEKQYAMFGLRVPAASSVLKISSN